MRTATFILLALLVFPLLAQETQSVTNATPTPESKSVEQTWKDPSTGLSWAYEILPDDTAKVTGVSLVDHSRLEIPDELNGHAVTVIGSNVSVIAGVDISTKLSFLSLPDSVREIEPFAFANYKSRETPNQKEFWWDSCVTTLYLPANLETIGEGAFECWYDLDTIIFPDGLKTIGPKSFRNCQNLILVDFPSSLSSIGAEAFKGCISLKGIIISYSTCANGLNQKAFYQCEALETILFNGGPDLLSDQLHFKYPREWRSCKWAVSEEFASGWVMLYMTGAIKGIDPAIISADKWEEMLDRCRNLAKSTVRTNRILRAMNSRY